MVRDTESQKVKARDERIDYLKRVIEDLENTLPDFYCSGHETQNRYQQELNKLQGVIN